MCSSSARARRSAGRGSRPRLPVPGRSRPGAARARCVPGRAVRAWPDRARAGRRDRRSRPRLHVRPLLVTDRGSVALRPGKPNRAEEPAILEAWTEAAGIPTLGRIEARDHRGWRHVLAAPGPLLYRSDASEQCQRGLQLGALVGGDVRVYDVPYWKGAAELVHLMSVISPVADDLAVVYLPSCRPVSGNCSSISRSAGRCRRRVPDARLQRAGGAAWRRHHGRRQPGDLGSLGRGRLRGSPLPGDPDRDRRLGRPDVHDPADPS